MISKVRLRQNTEAVKADTKSALQTVFDSLNRGQQKKILSVPQVKALMERYGVDIGSS